MTGQTRGDSKRKHAFPAMLVQFTTDDLRALIAEALAGASDEVLDAKGAADLLKAPEATIREWARRGVIPAAKLGVEWRFTRSELLACCKSGKKGRAA